MHVNRKNSLKMHECLEDIKMKLIAEWEIFPHYLHHVLCFREEIELQPLEPTTSKDFAAKAMDTLQRIINSNSNSREALNRHKSSMVTVLLSTKSRKGLDRPCGSEALGTLERSLAEVGLRLSDSMEFWHTIWHTSSDGSTGLEGVTVWQADQSIIQSSITSISISCDTLSTICFTKSPASGGKKSRGARYRLKSSVRILFTLLIHALLNVIRENDFLIILSLYVGWPGSVHVIACIPLVRFCQL